MANFVEKATLLLEDKSSAEIRKINRELNNLFKTAKKLSNMKVDIRGLDRADQMVNRLSRDLRKLSATPTRINVTANVNPAQVAINRLRDRADDPVNMPVNARGPRGANNRFGVGAGVGGLGFGLSSNSLVSTFLAGATFAAGRAAGKAVLNRSAEETTLRVLGRTDEQIRQLGETARKASAGQLIVTQTQALAATRNLENAGASGKALDMLARTASEAEAALTAQFGADEARRITEQAIKGVDLAGALDEGVRGSELLKAIVSGQITQGPDFNMASFLAAMRTTTATVSLTADAMIDFAAAVDEQGQRAGSALERFNKVLTAQGKGSGVDKAIMDKLELSGIREAARANRKLLEQDPFEFINKFVSPLLTEKGINLDDAAAVKKGLQEIGFVGQDLRFAQQQIIKRDERARNRARNKQVRYENFRNLAEKDIGLAMKAVAAQFDNVSVSVLKPFADQLAPRIVDVADGLNDLAQGTFSAKAIRSAIIAGVGGLGALAIENPGAVALGVAGTRLTGSAGALNRAAAALSKAAAVDGATGPGGGRGGRGRGATGRGRTDSVIGRVARDASRRTGAGVGGAAIGAGIELALGGDKYSAIGAGIGGAIGGFLTKSSTGALIGSQIGAAFGDKLGPLVDDAVKRVKDGFAKDPLGKMITEEGHKFFGQVRENQRIRDINIANRKRDEKLSYIQKGRAAADFAAKAVTLNASKAYFGEFPTSTNNVPTPKPQRGIVDELLASKPIKLEIVADPEVTQMLKMMKIEQQDARPETLMRNKDRDMLPASSTFDAMADRVATSYQQGNADFANTFAVAGPQVGTAITSPLVAAAPGVGSVIAGGLQALAPGIGAAIGAAAAAQINAAAANLRVTVNQPPKPANTGAANPVE